MLVLVVVVLVVVNEDGFWVLCWYLLWVPLSTSQDKVETVYSCAVGFPSKIDEKRLTSLRNWYQIPDELNLRLAVRNEWCYDPRFGVGIYEAYLLGGLRLALNDFTRETLFRLGVGICQLNPNA